MGDPSALDDFCQQEEKNQKEKKEKKQRNSTNQSAPVAAPNGVEVGKKKRTIIVRNIKKKSSISVFPGGYHISKTLMLWNSIKSN